MHIKNSVLCIWLLGDVEFGLLKIKKIGGVSTNESMGQEDASHSPLYVG
jgi:hypothetical protein